MNEEIRVLHVFMGMNRSGVPVMLMNYFRNIDRSRVVFDFALESSKPEDFDKEIELLGGKIYRIGARSNTIGFHIKLGRIIRENRYKIVHSHMNFRNLTILLAALLSGVRIRISHSHNSYTPNNILFRVLKGIIIGSLKMVSTHKLACSVIAGECLYGIKQIDRGNVIIVNNAICIEKFAYKPEVRIKVREKLGLLDKIVLGNVGNFLPLKNHGFMIEMFNELQKSVPEARLVLVGQGGLMVETRRKVSGFNLDDKVLFLGSRSDVIDLYQAFDLFVLTSFNEGLPLVLIEAQASGLRCVVSDNLTQESNPVKLMKIIKLESGQEVWADEIKDLLDTPYERSSNFEKLREKGFDIKVEAYKLEQLYIGMKD
ncbi:MAG: glycosyltransferase family 1 protein [Bacteroidales bacterium]|nr:glycosyltransferase family 1 protein [Bacteroidales bacterium]